MATFTVTSDTQTTATVVTATPTTFNVDGGLRGAPGISDVVDATASVKGIVRLAGDLSGTADSPTVPGLTTLDTRLDSVESVTNLPDDITDLDDTLTELLTHIPTTLGTGTNQNYRMPTPDEAAAVVKGLRLIAREMGKMYTDIDISDATTLLSGYGFTVTAGFDEIGLFPYVLVQAEYTYPSSSNYRAWGNYFFNMSAPLATLIEAPHPQTDGNSENISLATWRETPGALYIMSSVNRKARDYMVTEVSTDATGGTYTLQFRSQTTAPIAYNASISTVQSAVEALSSVGVGNVVVTGDPANTSLHTFINLSGDLYNSGSPTDTITVGTNSLTGSTFLTLDHDADVAHNYNSVFNRAASAFAAQGYAQLQLHGFSDMSSGVPRIFSAILSKGSSNDTKLTNVVKSALEAQGLDVGTRDSFDTQGIYFTGSPTGGTFTLTCDGQTTGAITYSTTQATLASSIQTALAALTSIRSGNVAVTISQNSNTVPAFVITFKNTLYHAGKQVTVASNSLTGGTSPAPAMLTANGTGLTAESNTQGDIADLNGTVFQHLEMSATVRNSASLSAKVVSALAKLNIPQLSAAVLPVLSESGHTTSQAPLVNGSGATIGTSPVAARADHRHPATTNTPSANQVIARNGANNAWTAYDPNDIGTNMTNVLHTTGDETATGIKVFTTDTSGYSVQILRATSTTNAEALLGFRISATPNNTSNMASIKAVRTDSPNSQDTKLVFRNRRSGAAISDVAEFDTSANLNMLASGKITGVADPTAAQDAATKNYVDTGGWVAAPATAASTGTQGQKAYDANYMYICTATNTWKRLAIATW